MYILGLNNIYRNPVNEKTFVTKTMETPKDENISLTEISSEENQVQKEDSVEISPEGRLAAEQNKEMQELTGSDIKEEDDEGVSEEQGGKVAVNQGKRARQIAAAQNRAQVQQVLALLQKDLSDCKAGLEKGWCDESEIAKVEALLASAKARLSQVPQETDQESSQGGLDAFDMASLM